MAEYERCVQPSRSRGYRGAAATNPLRRTRRKAALFAAETQPVEIAPSYVFLASDDGRYYTGEILAPTGKTTSR